MLVSLKNIFAAQAVAQTLESLPELNTTVLDTAFIDRPVHPFPTVGISELTAVTGTIPVVRRSGQPITIGGESLAVNFIAPQPIKPAVEVTAAELNDLKMIMANAGAVASWQARKVDTLRRLVRQTTEGMAAGVLYQGKVDWPQRSNGGQVANYVVDYGAPLTHTPATKLTSSSKISELHGLLLVMRTKIRQEGLGGQVALHAGADVFSVILDICQAYTSTTGGPSIKVELGEQGVVSLGGMRILLMDETYQHPVTGQWVDKLAPKMLVAYAIDTSGKVWYCAIDSISAGNSATPFYVVPETLPGDSGIRLIAQSKPLPARSPKTVCKCLAVD